MKLSNSQLSKKAPLSFKVILGLFLSFNLLLTPVALGVVVSQQSMIGQAAGFVSGAVAPEVQAQGNQKATPKPAAKKNAQPNFLQQLWNFITAPFKALFGGAAPKASPKPKVTPQTTPAESPAAVPTSEGSTTPSQPSTSQSTSTGSAPVVVTSLPKGVTYIDLIGKTIVDSNGKIYPSNSGLALSDKPSLGTSTNKFYGLFVRDFEVSTTGDVTARGKVTLGDENTDKLDFVGRVVSDFVPKSNDDVSLGKSGNAWLQAFITTVRSSTVNTGTLNVSLVKLDDGTAAAPALSFTDDSNSGLWRIGADHIALTTAGSAVSGIAINSSGNLGVGVTTPASTLAVRGNGVFGTGFGGMAAPANGLLVQGSVGIGISVPSQTFQIGTAGNSLVFTSGGNLGVGVTTPLNTLDVVGTTQLRGTGGVVGLAVTNDGRVGIGRTNPGSTLALAVQGNVGLGVTTANSTLAVSGNGVFGTGYAGMAGPTSGLLVQGNVGFGTSAPSQIFQVGTGSNALVFTSGGNLGIGTTSPAYDLEVMTIARIRGGGDNVGLVVASNGNVGIGITAPSASLQNTGNALIGYSGTTYGPASGLAVSGNVGVGVTTANNALQVLGAGLFSGTWGGAVVPTNGLVVEGNTGIGISVPSQLFQVGTAGNALVHTSGGNLGVGTTTPSQALEVIGTARIRGAVGNTGLVVASNGNVGIGTTAPGAGLQLTTNGLIGYTGNVYGPASGLAVSGNVGIGVTTANNVLQVLGAGLFTSTWGGAVVPANGLVVEGSVGIGISIPSQTLQINTLGDSFVVTSGGNVGVGTSTPTQDLEVIGTARIRGAVGNTGLVVAANGNVGIGTTAPGATVQNTGNELIGYTGNVYGPASGLAVSGNVGIGVTTANNVLQVLGAGLFTATWGGAVVPANGLVVEGSVGIGISVPSQLFQVGTAGNALVHTSGGNLGVGVTTPLNTLHVLGTVRVNGNAGNDTFGITSSGRVGVGTTAPGGTFSVSGNTSLGTFAGLAGPANGLAVSGNVGVGVTTANNALQVAGAGLFSTTWGGAVVPTNGLVVEGNTGIGISVPSQLFQVGTAGDSFVVTSGGNVGVGTSTPTQDLEVIGTARIRGAVGNSGFNVISSGNVGIGTTAPPSIFNVASGSVGIGVSAAYDTNAGLLVTSGNVGIGVTNAARALDVNSTIVRFRENTAAPTLAYDGDFAIGSLASDSAAGRMWVRSRGLTFRFQSTAETADYSEFFYQGDGGLQAGDVAVADSGVSPVAGTGKVKKSTGAYQGALGVVTTYQRGTGYNNPNDDRQFDPQFANVGMLGHIEVNVSTENGAIKPGDFLTSSPQAGVAMKATKAGPVIGQAVGSYDGAGVGKVMTLVKPAYYNGGTLQDLLLASQPAGVDVLSADTSATLDFSQRVLASLVGQLAERKSDSDLVLDRVAAGVEVITPQITADNVLAGVIKPLVGKNLAVQLNSDQAFEIKGEAGESVITFDAAGNAFFKGEVVAKSVRADQISGLRVVTDEVVSRKVAALLDAYKSSTDAATADVAGASTAPAIDANVLVKLNADGGITIGGSAEFKGQSLFASIVEFVSNVVLKGDVSFIGRVFLPKDSVGTAVIKAGADSVTVSFARGYDSAPSVNVTQTSSGSVDWDVRFVVQGLSGSGFTVKLNKAAPSDMVFSWTAFSQSNSFTSTAPAAAPAASSAPAATPAPSSTPAPSAESSPSPEPSPAPSPSAAPEATGSATTQ